MMSNIMVILLLLRIIIYDLLFLHIEYVSVFILLVTLAWQNYAYIFNFPLMLCIMYILRSITGKNNLGNADIWLIPVISIYFSSIETVLYIILLSCLTMYIHARKYRLYEVPFGSHVAIIFLFIYVYDIISWYFRVLI